ncbi:DNA/RNA nuclease SfsA [Candidatus Poribacteria bacterium]
MIYEGEFIEVQFVERPNRFLSVVMVDGRKEYAHVPNPGRIQELLLPGVTVVLRKENNPNRKTRYTLVMVYKNGILVSLDTMLPNRLAAEAIKDGVLEDFAGYKLVRREAQYKNSRFDLLLSKNGKLCFVEVKSVSLVQGKTAMFPDAPTLRGTRHVHHLMEAMDEGYEAAILFLIQRHDADRFTTHDDMDPEFARALRQAKAHGVKAYVYKCKVGMDEIKIDQRVSMLL